MANIFDNFDDAPEPVDSEKLATKARADEALLATEFTVEKSLKSIKFAVVVAFVLSLAALVGAGYLYQSFNAEKRERQAIEIGQKDVIASAGLLEEQVTQYKTVIERMREQVGNYAKERKEFKQEFEANEIEISNLQKKVQALEDLNKRTVAEKATVAKKLDMTASELSTAEEALNTTRSELTEAREQLVTVETTLEQTEEQVDPKKSSKPEVLSVNRVYNFAVVNLGKKDGVKIGDKLNVFREGKPVGLVQVEKLYDNFTAATIVKESRDGAIAQGDSIRLGS